VRTKSIVDRLELDETRVAVVCLDRKGVPVSSANVAPMTTGTQIPQIDQNRYIPKHRTILGENSVEDEALGPIRIEVQVEHYDETLDQLIEEKRRM